MSYYVAVSLATIVVVWAWKFFSWAWLEPRRMERFLRSQGLRGNPYRFLFGDSKEISEMYLVANSKSINPSDDTLPRVMPFIQKTIQTYGNNAFAWIGPIPRIIISEPELMKDVLTKHRDYQKSFRSNKIIRLVVGGLGHYEGDEWHNSRMKLNHAFYLEKLKQMVPTMQSCTENIFNQWKSKLSKDGSSVVDVLSSLEDYSGSVVTYSLFHTPYDDNMRRTFDYLRDIAILTNTASKPFSFPGLEFLPSENKRKAMEMGRYVNQSLTNMINTRLETRWAQETISAGNHDLLDLFLDELYENKEKISDQDRLSIIEEAIAQIKIFYFGGYLTTPNLLVWTMISLATHQNWQARAREEVLNVFGDGGTLTDDGLSQLKTITMIFYEVLRLYPPVMELSRVATRETQLGNLRIPKGVLLQMPIAMIHRRPEIWGKDSYEFNPDRFAQGVLKATNGQPAAFIPFSAGPRICIGQNFAMMEAKAFMVQLLRTFSFELSPAYKHAPYTAFTVEPQYGAPLLLRKL